MQEENCQGKNMQKHVWTGNQLHIQRRDQVSNLGSIGATWGKYRYTTCFPQAGACRENAHFHLQPRKFTGEICCGSHLPVMYGGELLCLWIFSYLSPPSKRELPFVSGLNHARILFISQWITWYRLCAQIVPNYCAKSDGTITHLHTWPP